MIRPNAAHSLLVSFLFVLLVLSIAIEFLAFQIVKQSDIGGTDQLLYGHIEQLETQGTLPREPEILSRIAVTSLRSIAKGRTSHLVLLNAGGGVVYSDCSDSLLHIFLSAPAAAGKPTTIVAPGGEELRVLSSNLSNRFIVLTALSLPSALQLIGQGFERTWFFLPLPFFIVLGLAGWIFTQYLYPARELNNYLRALLEQPLDKPVLTLPRIPIGSMGNLMQTASKVVEKFINVRNQALQFSSYASHELRTNLSVLRTQLEAGLDVDARGSKKTIIMAYDETLRITKIVEDLLSLSTIQAGSFRLHLEPIHVNQFLQKFYEDALFLTRQKNISVVLKKGEEISLIGDPLRLNEVLFILLDNAIKNSPEGSRIRIGYEVDGKELRLRFADTGAGISEGDLPFVFEPFYQSAKARDPRRGVGLGLALARWIMNLHGGSISVQSQLGEGTTFQLTFYLEKPAG